MPGLVLTPGRHAESGIRGYTLGMPTPHSLARRLAGAAALSLALAPALAPAGAQQTPVRKDAPATPAAAAAAPRLDQPVPADPAVTVGTLPNGLRYYVRANRRPEKRASLRLVVNAGSVLEDEDQRGLAHFVEHMAFNGTRRFEKSAIVDFLEKSGVRFGADLNAYTSFDETVYQLEVPTDTARLLDTAVQILADWAGGITFDSAEVVKERGVVLEEWRLGQGADTRVFNKQRPVIFAGSRYAERLPIGDPETIRDADAGRLRRFYRDWYRADLMAVVAVGDFDPKAVEALIRREFASLPRPTAPRERPTWPVPDHDSTYVTVATDPELTSSSVGVLWLKPVPPTGTVRDFRRELVERLYSGMLNGRLYEISQQANAPFLGAGSGEGRLVRSKQAYQVGAGVRDGEITRGLEAVLVEARRVDQFGFTATELGREKQDMLRAFERANAERDKTNSGAFVSSYVDNFLQGDPFPSIEASYGLVRALLPTITLEEVNAVARDVISDRNRAVIASAPEKAGLTPPTDAELRAVLARAGGAGLTAYADNVSDAPLLPRLPAPGRVTSERKYPAVGVTEWTLSNGIRVVLKPTDFKADEVRFTASSRGGASLVPERDYPSAAVASIVVPQSGLGAFGRVELEKKLAGTAAGVTPYIGLYNEGLSGGASPRDLDVLFQLIHLTVTAPRADSAAYQAFRSQVEAYVANRGASPEQVFGDTVAVTMAQHSPYARPITREFLDQIDLQTALRVYRERFADVGDFVFTFVGSFSPDSLRPLAERYLASLPARGRQETWRDVGLRPPTGVVERTVRRGVEPKAQTRLVFTGPFTQSRENRFALLALQEVLNFRLRERLREALGGTYGVSVSAGSARVPRSEYTATVAFGSSPERVEELVRAVFAEIDSLKANGASADDIAKVKELQLRERETSLKQNGFWVGQLSARAEWGEDYGDILTYPKLLDTLTPQMVRDAARAYLNRANYARFTLLPEAPKQ
jgi:zinc protease